MLAEEFGGVAKELQHNTLEKTKKKKVTCCTLKEREIGGQKKKEIGGGGRGIIFPFLLLPSMLDANDEVRK